MVRIERDAAYAFAKITAQPVAGTDQHRQVLVLARMDDTPTWAEESGRARKAGKSKRPPRKTD